MKASLTPDRLRELLGEPLLTSREVGAYLGLHHKTVERYARQGLLPYVRVGGAMRFRVEDIRSHVQGHLVPGRRTAKEPIGMVAETAASDAAPPPPTSRWRPPRIDQDRP